MKTLSLATYPIPSDPTQAYPIKDALVNVLFGQPHLKGRDILQRDDVARKILAADESVAFEDAEFALVRAAFETAEGFSRNDVELVRRVLDLT